MRSAHLKQQDWVFASRTGFEPTCAYAQWAHTHRFLSVWPDMPGPKVTGPSSPGILAHI